MRVWLWCAFLLAGCPGNRTDDTGPGVEEGCITVDGAGGYKFLADALDAAGPGAVVELCAGTFEESVVVAQDVTIAGAGATETHWVPPVNEAALEVLAGASATVRGVRIATTRNGITVGAGGHLVVEDVEVFQPGSWGVEGTGATLDLTGLVVRRPVWGGVRANGGTLTLADSIVSGGTGFGVLLEAGASGTLTGNTIEDLVLTTPEDPQTLWDGWGVALKGGSSATLTGNTITGNILGGLWLEEQSTATLTGDLLEENYAGIWLANSTIDLQDVQVLGSTQYSLVSEANGSVTLDKVALDADATTSPEGSAGSPLAGGYGLIMTSGGELTATDVTISDHNGGGLYLVGTVSENMPVTLERVTIENNQAESMFMQWVQATLTDVDIADTRTHDERCAPDGFTYSCNWGFAAFLSELTWTGGALRGNGAIGGILSDSRAVLTGIELADNALYGVWVDGGASLALNGGNVTGLGESALYVQNGGAAVVDRTSFEDHTHTDTFDFGDGSTWHLMNQGTDIRVIDATVQVHDATFARGDAGIWATDVDDPALSTRVEVYGSTFEDYHLSAVNGSGAAMVVEDTTFTRNGRSAVRCAGGGTLTMQDVLMQDAVITQSVTETRNAAGEVIATSATDLYGPALTVSACPVTLDGLALEHMADQAILLDDSPSDIDGLLVRDVNLEEGIAAEPAVEIVHDSTSSHVFLSSVTITGVQAGSALSLRGRATDTDPLVSLTDVRIGVDDDGVSGVADRGLVVEGVAGLAGTRLEVANTGGPAVDLELSDTTLTDVVVTSAGGSGARVNGGLHALTGLTVQSAAEWGMECTEASDPAQGLQVPDFTTCLDPNVTGTLGAFSGCEPCAAPTCSDGTRNGDETGVDCGGSCGLCAGATCTLADECASGICDGTCAQPTCEDGETCDLPDDCASGVCDGTCSVPTCDDGVSNGDETGVDCGGACGLCDGETCTLAEDCASGVCDGTCSVPACDDGVLNGDETEVDCGGACGLCDGDACTQPSECASGLCDVTCQPSPA